MERERQSGSAVASDVDDRSDGRVDAEQRRSGWSVPFLRDLESYRFRGVRDLAGRPGVRSPVRTGEAMIIKTLYSQLLFSSRTTAPGRERVEYALVTT